MTQFIKKDAVVAEIDKLLDDEYQCSSYDEATGFQHALGLIKSFITNLEVKEVDLVKELDDYVYQEGLVNCYEIAPIAKHFFELGMAVGNKAQKGE